MKKAAEPPLSFKLSRDLGRVRARYRLAANLPENLLDVFGSFIDNILKSLIFLILASVRSPCGAFSLK
jgi:hypothetical protein